MNPASITTPWSRFGWVYTSLFLVFLAFPAAAVATSPHGPATKVFGYGVIAIFAIVYVLGFRGSLIVTDRTDRWPYLAVLTLLALATIPIIGFEAFGFATYLISFAMVVISLPAGVAVTAASVTIALAGWMADKPFALGFAFICLGVAATTGLSRWFSERTHDAINNQIARDLAEDRNRVARDVHDVLGHSLTTIVVKAELANRLLEVDPERARHEMGEVERIARTSLAEIRATIGGLRATSMPDELDNARRALQSAGVAVDAPDDVRDVDPAARITIAWTIREAATNIARHANATRATIRWGPNWVTVTDDGVGIGGASEGNGLTGLRERVAAVGGTLTVGPGTDGEGTLLRVTQP